jgi:hypothetical protein
MQSSCQVLKKLELYQIILENTQISNLMKIRRVGAELFHADGGQTQTPRS